MVITTKDHDEGYCLTDYLAAVVASIVAGTGFVSDFLAGFTDTFGGRSESYQQALSNPYADATREIEARSARCGANAAESARRIRAMYGDRVCASFLAGKADELSMGAIELSAADPAERF